ncbi:MAG: 3-phosphoshikimate 1-carboxyvinyltransferase [Bacteroidia bacterium]|jgi:3-phosphoshikimate 1-carboxyvinyltransferase
MAGSIILEPTSGPLRGKVILPISKSICNRLLILSKLAGQEFPEDQLSSADDSRLLFDALNSNETTINVENAGTAFRFLTAYFSIQDGTETTLTGSQAMMKRPIGPLVEALKSLGAEIEYEGKEGFPPLRIKGRKLKGGRVKIGSDVSSQFISALMLIGSTMEKGLEIELDGDPVSSSYIEMTKALMANCGADIDQTENQILVQNSPLDIQSTSIERDWSSASYYYGMAALRPNSEILLKGLCLDSVQGDRRIAELMKPLGVESTQTEKGVVIQSKDVSNPRPFYYDLSSEPDLVQTLVCVHALRSDEVVYSGIDHLRFKETDRLAAVQTELKKFNIKLEETDGSWKQSGKANWNGKAISTYDDHRMAMAFSLFSLQFSGLIIENPAVVNKSFPEFWNQLAELSFSSI